ncbi:TraR/DksA family transcriptional regulator [Enterovibrio sp. NIFS-20-8]|nr:TraR/DksA family transcriptional regulator [Enterovibrio paralichthyis]
MSEQRAQLEQLKAHINDELMLLKEQTDPVMLDQQSFGRVSRMDAMQQHELAKSNYRYYQTQLKEVELAIKRMDDEEYGYCEECGEEIPAARLAVKPEVRLCVSCQQNHE